MKTCKECGHKIKQKLHVYSSGNGCLSLTWVYDMRDTPNSGKTVTKAAALRYLESKDGQYLKKKNWVPVLISGRWVLAQQIKRTGPNRLRINGESYEYSVDTSLFCGRVEEANLTTTYKMRVKGKRQVFEMKNLSKRMVIRFFLNHEDDLKPQFAK